MKVKELISILEKLDSDAEIAYEITNEYGNGIEVRDFSIEQVLIGGEEVYLMSEW